MALRMTAMANIEYGETTGSVAREAECNQDTVRRYANAGLIDAKRLPDGTRVFRADAAETLRNLLAKREPWRAKAK